MASGEYFAAANAPPTLLDDVGLERVGSRDVNGQLLFHVRCHSQATRYSQEASLFWS
jgi:hypothetical protein